MFKLTIHYHYLVRTVVIKVGGEHFNTPMFGEVKDGYSTVGVHRNGNGAIRERMGSFLNTGGFNICTHKQVRIDWTKISKIKFTWEHETIVETRHWYNWIRKIYYKRYYPNGIKHVYITSNNRVTSACNLNNSRKRTFQVLP